VEETIKFLMENGYSVLFGWVLLEQAGLPMPAAPLFIAAGALIHAGHLSLVPICAVAVTASLISDLFWYQIGRVRGRAVLSFLCRLSLDPDACLRDINQIFIRHGGRSLLVAKFVPGLSTVTPPLAGIFNMGVSKFLLLDGFGALVWVSAFAGLGYQFSHQIEYVAARMAKLGWGAGGLAAAGLVAYVGWKYLRRRRFLGGLVSARITPEELRKRLEAGEEDLMVVDVRAPFEISKEPFTIPGALLFPLEQLERELHKIPRDRDIIVCCY
jgi:membrane protein DedA with SNARE-associated domain